ncbi:DsbA family protein [Novosphingobium album (ex Liu et al. 2023)]|uniref:Thioredoxin domain-containing protein n=1 Tax=Novosphingobium album (ex Liu et al. 2023) TaxID=3031130 RepID=A0ABT5WJZ1_9SPHN|nr:thioredoxin domain-containing protein [Novosphingobium album (ex Liu et al. 2023)]MDE8650358.1 thioredoxin domain-containing protein [Novosphingobium album (ex Liu et al. 2023)]
MNRILRIAAVAACAMLSLAASPPHPDWNATIAQRPNGSHTLGNPDAAVKVTEYVSYTCPHCARFNQEADAPLRLAYVAPGKVSVTVQHLIRDPIDLTVAMLANCGDQKLFFRRHNAFMATQDKWMGKLDSFTPAQQARWSTGAISARLKAIADDFGFYATMQQWGFDRPAVDRCLADPAMAKTILDQTHEASELGVDSTPSFAINGTLLADTHTWSALDTQIKARM